MSSGWSQLICHQRVSRHFISNSFYMTISPTSNITEDDISSVQDGISPWECIYQSDF